MATKPLREGQVHSVIVRPALQKFEVHGAPLREGSPANVAERVVGSGRRVVRQIDLLRSFLTTASGEDVIYLQRHVVAELSLNAGGHLVAVRSLASRVVNFLRERTIHTTRNQVDIASALERLLESRLGTIEPTQIPLSNGCEVRAPVVEDLVFKTVQIALRLLDSIIWSERVEQPIPTAQNRPVIQAEVYSEARSEVCLLARQIARQPWQETHLLRVRVGIEVVSQAQVERDIAADLPVILQPAGKEVPNDPVAMLGIGQAVVDPPGNGGQRRQIPCGGVVPNREKGLEIGGWRSRIRLYDAITSQTPAKLIVESHVLAAHFQVVPPQRSAEVISNGLCVLKNIQWAGADRIATQHDDYRSAVQDRMIRKISPFPSNRRLILTFVVGEPSF